MRQEFRVAAQACSALGAHVRDGLQALRGSDRTHVRAKDTRRLAGSVAVEAALAKALPNSPLWDYGVGYRPSDNRNDVVHWVEVHPATDGEVRSVKAKLEWLIEWMTENAAELAKMDRRFVWVSSGRTHFSPTSPGLKRLAQKGCRHVGKVYTIE